MSQYKKGCAMEESAVGKPEKEINKTKNLFALALGYFVDQGRLNPCRFLALCSGKFGA